MSIAVNIRTLRKEHEMSQDELASRLGYRSFTTIQKWESGVSEPPLKVAKALADIFGVDIDTLYGDAAAAPTLSDRDIALLEKYHSLNALGKDKLDERADELCEMEKYKKDAANSSAAG